MVLLGIGEYCSKKSLISPSRKFRDFSLLVQIYLDFSSVIHLSAQVYTTTMEDSTTPGPHFSS